MTTTNAGTTGTPAPAAPQLPPNVLLFAPSQPTATRSLLNGKIFTRLTTTAKTEPAQIQAAVKNIAADDKPSVRENFCLAYRHGILIFDGAESDELNAEVEDAHHEHFRQVCLALKDADIDLDVAGCISDAPSITQAGFQLDALNPGTVIVIDLMGGDDSDDDSDDEDDDEATLEAKLGALAGDGKGTTIE